MSASPGFTGRLLIGDFSLSASTQKVTAVSTQTMLDATCFGPTGNAKVFIPGAMTSTFAVNGLVDTDGTSGAQLDQIATWTGTDVVSVAQRGFTLGREVWMPSALRQQWQQDSAVNDLVKFSLALQTDGICDFGVSLHDLGAETASVDGTAVDGAAASAGGGAGHLHVTAFSGFTNIVVKVQHSTDNVTFADLITFSTVSGATQQRSTVTGTVNRYVRASWTKSGSGSCTFAVAFARR